MGRAQYLRNPHCSYGKVAVGECCDNVHGNVKERSVDDRGHEREKTGKLKTFHNGYSYENKDTLKKVLSYAEGKLWDKFRPLHMKDIRGSNHHRHTEIGFSGKSGGTSHNHNGEYVSDLRMKHFFLYNSHPQKSKWTFGV